MNMLMSMEFGQYYARLPLGEIANIVNCSAIDIEWDSVVDSNQLSYIIGNPPFVGTAYQSKQQKEDLARVCQDIESYGMLDYVSLWFIIASKYTSNSNIKVAFVSTNSITQGEQASILWDYLFNKLKIKINFGYTTFKWDNEAKKKAGVHVVIIGFSHFNAKNKQLFILDNITGNHICHNVDVINQYLVNYKELIIAPSRNQISKQPNLSTGSALRDGGHLIISKDEYESFIKSEPFLSVCIKRFVSAEEFLYNTIRYCFWLKDVSPDFIKQSDILKGKLSMVRNFRLESSRKGTNQMANYPNLFVEDRQPTASFLLIPKVTSDQRKYIPIGFMDRDYIITDKVFYLPNATLFHFGVLTSLMHVTWVKKLCSRLSTSLSYSSNIVYNNFSWPENPSESQIQKIEQAAQKVLDARALFPESSLAVLYDPLTMPPELVKAHQELDKAVDLAYRPQPFLSEAKRMEFLFELYEKYTANLFTKEKVKKSAKKGTGKAKE
jgi:hypothetical protein